MNSKPSAVNFPEPAVRLFGNPTGNTSVALCHVSMGKSKGLYERIIRYPTITVIDPLHDTIVDTSPEDSMDHGTTELKWHWGLLHMFIYP